MKTYTDRQTEVKTKHCKVTHRIEVIAKTQANVNVNPYTQSITRANMTQHSQSKQPNLARD